jgi:hypothetical protein
MGTLKYLPLLTLFLIGCMDYPSHETTVRTDQSNLKFSAGDEIRVPVSFYSRCKGTITSYLPYYGSESGPKYFVSFSCPNIGRIKDDILISESSMVKYVEKK